ncbi:MAG: polyprenyl synthetase family protein [Fidelibacterota bacterium]|nr:MAG: polyprenyl synthetase family protein [Candidatus Neomarinimicrobiota bacterium]
MPVASASAASTSKLLIQALGLVEEIGYLKTFIGDWIESSDPEVRELLNWQFLGNSKYFRPVTVFACYKAVNPEPIDAKIIRSAAALEIVHNVSLIIDDILDRSRHRRGKLTLHCRFGSLPALMTAGYITSSVFEIIRQDTYDVKLIANLIKRLGVAECMQWRLRREPLGVEDWRELAGEDTGSMFETCACLGTRGEKMRTYGRLLGILYHGCDDLADVRGAEALGGGGYEDVRDGILTLPAAIAIRDPAVAVQFRNPTKDGVKFLKHKLESALPEAERYLNSIAEDAAREANTMALNPEPLITLIQHTRRLSKS